MTDATANVGILRIAPFILGDLLKLPAGNSIIGARVTVGEEIELLISGDDMPPSELKETPIVTLNLHLESRQMARWRETRLLANWGHRPSVAWIVRDWERAP